MSEKKKLTLEIAKHFLNDPNRNRFRPIHLAYNRNKDIQLDLSDFEQIELDAARYLVKECKSPMDLSGLESIPLDLSNVLAQHNNVIVL